MKKGNRMVVHVEYFIYNTMGTIGSVGGTFGLFIGFSVTGFISSAIEFLKKFKYARRIYNSGDKEISKSDQNSVDLEKNNADDQTGLFYENDLSRGEIKVPKSHSTQTMVVEFVHGNRKRPK